jgi:hypothetical protein
MDGLTNNFIKEKKQKAEKQREHHGSAERKVKPEIPPLYFNVERKMA